MGETTKHIGDRGEDLAADYLAGQGYRVLDRNYRFEHAEIDLVCFDPAASGDRGGELVFVEVKTRSGLGFGRPEEAVTAEKKEHLVYASRAYLYERKLEGAPCRFDVLAIVLHEGAPPDVEHFKNAFWAT